MRKDDRALSWESFGITPVVRNIMIDDITGHSDLGYGMDMDEEEWEKLQNRLRAEKERRTNGSYRPV